MDSSFGRRLYTPKGMAVIDAAAAQSGLDGLTLVSRAGQAVAAAALRHYPQALRFVVLCGPGRNGADGFIAAQALSECGTPVSLYAFGSSLSGDADAARRACRLLPQALQDYQPLQGDVIIDALFGAGLSRPLPQVVADLIAVVTSRGVPVLAVDLPSGIDGRSGMARPIAFQAAHTVTFMAQTPGHVLLPGRVHCGEIEVFDIGIPARIMDAMAEPLMLVDPSLWARCHVAPGLADHKYRRGHLTVLSGPAYATGAARLSAKAAMRAGAGLVTLAATDEGPLDAMAELAAHVTAAMLTRIATAHALSDWLTDVRHGSFVRGPGFSRPDMARHYVETIGRAKARLVLDADGLTAFSQDAALLKAFFGGPQCRLILTPHEGEFVRLFAAPMASAFKEDVGTTLPDRGAVAPGKVEKARFAADLTGAVVVYKGADTVIAAPDGRVAIETRGPPRLATAGSGDVLTGIIGALVAQGFPAFEAACAGVYLHAQAALRSKPGMTAEDLADHVRPV